jgi:hypothetical protein
MANTPKFAVKPEDEAVLTKLYQADATFGGEAIQGEWVLVPMKGVSGGGVARMPGNAKRQPALAVSVKPEGKKHAVVLTSMAQLEAYKALLENPRVIELLKAIETLKYNPTDKAVMSI